MSGNTGSQSPAREENKTLGHSSPSQEAKKSLSDAEQRPGVSGQQGKEHESSGGGVSAEALKTAQAAADSLGEAGGSRKDVETGQAQ